MIAIIAAMKEELDALLAYATDSRVAVLPKEEATVAKIANKEVVGCLSGIGKSNAASTATMLIERFNVSTVLNIGTAGGLLEQQEVCDVVVSTKVAFHDVDLTAFNHPKGWDFTTFVYHPDQRLIELIKTLDKDKYPTIWYGPIVTGDQFINKPEAIQDIMKNYPGSYAVEMEGAAIAQVATKYKIPFVIVRSLSDIVIKDENQLTFKEYLLKATKSNAEFIVDLLAKL